MEFVKHDIVMVPEISGKNRSRKTDEKAKRLKILVERSQNVLESYWKFSKQAIVQ